MSLVQAIVFAVIGIGLAAIVAAIAVLAFLIVRDWQQWRQDRAALRQFDARYARVLAEATREWESLR